MALMLREARMASLSARVGSSLEETLAERMTHMSHRLTLTDLRSALLRGEPWQNTVSIRVSSSYTESYIHQGWRSWAGSAGSSTPSWCSPCSPPRRRVSARGSGSWRLSEASRGCGARSWNFRGQRTDRQPRGHWGQSWPPGYDPEQCCISAVKRYWGGMELTSMQSSIHLAGIQWNIPVLSYFISVLMKSKSLAWSSAIPTSSLPDIALSAVLAWGLAMERCQSIHMSSQGNRTQTVIGNWATSSTLCISLVENIHLILDIDILSMTEISFYKWVLQSC